MQEMKILGEQVKFFKNTGEHKVLNLVNLGPVLVSLVNKLSVNLKDTSVLHRGSTSVGLAMQILLKFL